MYFVIENPEHDQLKARLRMIRTDESGWVTYYVDPQDGEEWIEYWPYEEDEEDHAPSVLRKLLIPSDLETFLVACLTSESPDDWQGLAGHLSGSDVDADELFEILETRRREFTAKALLGFGQSLEIRDRRVLVGMTHEQVIASYEALVAKRRRISEITDPA